jgi:hypothetical protein
MVYLPITPRKKNITKNHAPMDTITYFLIGALLLLPWAVIYFFKPALRKKMLKTSIMGGLAGFIAEYWYFKDYWHPPTLLGQTVVSFEDFLFGFTITGLSVTIYQVFFPVTTERTEKNRKKLFGIMFLCGVAAMMILNVLLKYNSIIVSCICFVCFTLLMMYIRPDLMGQAFFSGLLTLLVILPVYLLLFDLLNTGYWDKYWLLARTPLGLRVLGHIPVTELSWYFTWGCFAGTAHSFASGYVKVRQAGTEEITGAIKM